MASGIANHPFLYSPRWRDIENLDPFNRQLLEERDRELEDYLGSLSGGGLGSGIRLSHTASQNVTGLSDSCAPVNTDNVDYNTTGGHATTGTYIGKTVIEVVTGGIWHATGYGLFTGDPDDGAGYALLQCTGDIGVRSDTVNEVLGEGHFIDLSMDFQAETGDFIALLACIEGGEVGGTISVANARLAAHLVG